MQTLLVCIAYYFTDVVNVSTGPSYSKNLYKITESLLFGHRWNSSLDQMLSRVWRTEKTCCCRTTKPCNWKYNKERVWVRSNYQSLWKQAGLCSFLLGIVHLDYKLLSIYIFKKSTLLTGSFSSTVATFPSPSETVNVFPVGWTCQSRQKTGPSCYWRSRRTLTIRKTVWKRLSLILGTGDTDLLNPSNEAHWSAYVLRQQGAVCSRFGDINYACHLTCLLFWLYWTWDNVTARGKCLVPFGFLHIEAHAGGVTTVVLKTPVGSNSGNNSTRNPTPHNFSYDISVVLRWKCPSGNINE